MPLKDSLESLSTETKGLVLGFIGVFCFSLTFPATRVAVRSLDPTFVGLGRSVVAGILAGFLLLITRQKLPSRDQIKSLLIVAAGVIVGFPLLSTWAMRRLPASHGAIIGGILPLVTIVVAAIRAGERPSRGFWGASLLGSMAVVLFAFVSGAQEAHLADLSADLALLGAVLAAAVGYAEGGR
ncbi:MAG: DMT family transporter, partial [Candidatus Manganitrophaceae bacterium]